MFLNLNFSFLIKNLKNYRADPFFERLKFFPIPNPMAPWIALFRCGAGGLRRAFNFWRAFEMWGFRASWTNLFRRAVDCFWTSPLRRAFNFWRVWGFRASWTNLFWRAVDCFWTSPCRAVWTSPLGRTSPRRHGD
jgi:hypothetical protein